MISCAYDSTESDTDIISSKFRAYQSSLNSVKNQDFINSVANIIDKSNNNSCNYTETTEKLIKKISNDTNYNRQQYIKSVLDSLRLKANDKFEKLISELFEKNGYVLIRNNYYDKEGGDIDLVFQAFEEQTLLNDISFLNDLMAEVSGIFPNMIGSVETTAPKTATEINTKSQGQMTRLSMLVDTINQDFIIANVKKVAKLCADFKSGVETIFINKDNQPETIEIDDFVRQAEYKYTYSDSSNTTLKSEQADMLVQAVERFKVAGLELNLPEIFVWYFEQKGVENAERFLGEVNNTQILPNLQNIIEANQDTLSDINLRK